MVHRDEMMAQLTAHGDRVIDEVIISRQEMATMNDLYFSRITASVKRLTALHPEHEAALNSYLERERSENELLQTDVVCATWVIRRGDG